MAAEPTTYRQDVIAKVCAVRCKCPPISEPNTSIGFIKDGSLVGGVTYSSYSGREIWAAIWVDDRSVWSRKNLKTMFSYPFEECGVVSIRTIAAVTNTASMKMTEQLGFVREGLYRKYFPNDVDAQVWGMLREECKWI